MGRHRCENTKGYRKIKAIGHSRARKNGYVLEHVFLAQKALGKHLPKCHPVHHVDGNPSNNTPSNLVICQDASYHGLLHARTRSYRATGSVNNRFCEICKTWLDVSNFYADSNGNKTYGKKVYVCKKCQSEKAKKRMSIPENRTLFNQKQNEKRRSNLEGWRAKRREYYHKNIEVMRAKSRQLQEAEKEALRSCERRVLGAEESWALLNHWRINEPLMESVVTVPAKK